MELRFVALEDRHLSLQPFSPELESGVRQALDHDHETWAILLTPGFGPHFGAWWAAALADAEAGRRQPYAVVLQATGEVVGTSSFIDIRPRDRAVEIGSTFYRPDVRGGVVNPACKRLMMAHAFACGAGRVQFKVDARNRRSQGAVTRLGAQREGALRKTQITWTGWRRDTVYFSVLDDEWPEVCAGLDARLD